MKKYFLFWMFALIFLVQTPFIFSLDCNKISIGNYQTCLSILNSNLTLQEKEILISNLDYNNKFFPDHNYIFQRNTNIKIDNPPIGVKNYNGEYVKDAWLSILSVMPSVQYNNDLFVPNQTKLLSAFNYKINAPVNYYSSDYPNTNLGDCKRIYTLIKNESENRVYVNNNYQGSGKLVDLKIESDSIIKSDYLMNVGYNIDHYYWETYCSYYRKGRCRQYSNRCSFNYNEIKQNSILIQDTLNVKYYNNTLIGDIKIIDSYKESNRININYSDSFYLNLNNSYYKFNKYSYEINYSKEPYYIQTLKAIDNNQLSSNNIQRSGNDLIIKNINNCKIKAHDFFNIIEKDCFLNVTNVSIKIQTDKFIYSSNETISIKISPDNLLVNLSYGNQSKIISNNTTFIADISNNKISADYSINHYEKIIFVKDKTKIKLIYSLSLFVILNYFLYSGLRKFFGGII
ncbi:MAG: hypothetical protein WC867_06035 [Candidatus Pacearchaeota archaeon]|jgi:hypothetical protein